jgi:hypothetical protein
LKGGPVELVFGKKEGDIVYVRKVADGARVDMKLPVSELAQVTKTRLDFVDPRLKGFTTQDAIRLAFNRGTTPIELQKNETAGTWSYLNPLAKKGKPAGADKVSGLLGLLAALYAEQVVAENASPDELRRHGLNPPRMKATVTLKGDKDNTRVYEIGNETEDKQHVYARQEGRPVLFTIRKDVYTRFATEDLRDPVVYRVDPAKVKRIKLRGWKGLVGPNPLVYLLERKGDGWSAVSPPTPAGFAPDPAKVNALLAAVAAPRAESFVDVGAKPQYGLDVAQNPNGLEITLEAEGGPTRTLVLGNKVGNGPQVYAASSGVPGEVFTITPAAIQKYTDKPASLQIKQ